MYLQGRATFACRFWMPHWCNQAHRCSMHGWCPPGHLLLPPHEWVLCKERKIHIHTLGCSLIPASILKKSNLMQPHDALTRQACRSKKGILRLQRMELPKVTHQLCDEIMVFGFHMLLPIICHVWINTKQVHFVHIPIKYYRNWSINLIASHQSQVEITWILWNAPNYWASWLQWSGQWSQASGRHQGLILCPHDCSCSDTALHYSAGTGPGDEIKKKKKACV